MTWIGMSINIPLKCLLTSMSCHENNFVNVLREKKINVKNQNRNAAKNSNQTSLPRRLDKTNRQSTNNVATFARRYLFVRGWCQTTTSVVESLRENNSGKHFLSRRKNPLGQMFRLVCVWT